MIAEPLTQVFSQRLYQARVMAGLSQQSLVDRAEGIVSKQAISLYEKGQRMPDSEVLIALAKALFVKPDFFFRPVQIELGPVAFRKRSKLTATEEESIKGKTQDFLERYQELETITASELPYENPLGDFPIIRTQGEAEAAAEQLRLVWDIGGDPIPNLLEMFEEHGVKVYELSDVSEAFDGLSANSPRFSVMVLNNDFDLVRKRFTAAHELAHLLLRFDDSLPQKEVEKLSHCFANALLIPASVLYKVLGVHREKISLAELIPLKEYWGISIAALMARAYSLKIISERAYINFRKYISTNRKELGLGNYLGKEKALRFDQLLSRALAQELISLGKAAALAQTTIAAIEAQMQWGIA